MNKFRKIISSILILFLLFSNVQFLHLKSVSVPRALAAEGTMSHSLSTGSAYTDTDIALADPLDGLPALAVVRTTPRDGKAGVFPETDIMVTFNQAIQKGAGFDNIRVTDAKGQSVNTTPTVWGDTLTIKPDTLAYDTLYTVTLPVGSVDGTGGTVLTAAYTFSFTTKFIITETYPADQGVDVSINMPVKVAFGSIVKEGPNFDRISLYPVDDSNAPVPLNPIQLSKIDNDTRSLMTITFQGILAPNSDYRVTIPAGAVKNVAGHRLDADYTFDFRTHQNITLPQVYFSMPADGAKSLSLNEDISITFNDDIVAGPNFDSVALSVYQSGAAVAISKEIDSDQLIITPAADLSYDTTYEVSIPAGAVANMASSDLLMDPYDFTFTTKRQILVATIPGNGSGNILHDAAPALLFDQPIIGTQLDAIVLKDSDGSQVPIRGYVDADTLIIAPLQFLESATTYTVEVPAGTVLVQDGTVNDGCSFSFTSTGWGWRWGHYNLPGLSNYVSIGETVKFCASEFVWVYNNAWLEKSIWDFGDGVTGRGNNVSYTCTNLGLYTFTLVCKEAKDGSYPHEFSNYYTISESFEAQPPPPPPPPPFNPETATLGVYPENIYVEPGEVGSYDLYLRDGAASAANQEIEVYLNTSEGEKSGYPSRLRRTLTTDSSGNVSFGETMPSWVTDDGFALLFRFYVGGKLKATASLICKYRVTATIYGYVRPELKEGSFDPPAGTTVVLKKKKDKATVATETVRNSGFYMLSGVPPGTYLMEVSAPGWEPVSDYVKIQPNQKFLSKDWSLKKVDPLWPNPVVTRVYSNYTDTSTGKSAVFLQDYYKGIYFKADIDWKGHIPGYVKFFIRSHSSSEVKEAENYSAGFNEGNYHVYTDKCEPGMLGVCAVSYDGTRSSVVDANAAIVRLDDLPVNSSLYQRALLRFNETNGEYSFPASLNLPTFVTPSINEIPVISGAPAQITGGETEGSVVLGPKGLLVVTIPEQSGLSAAEMADLVALEKAGTLAYKGLKKLRGKKSPSQVGMILFDFSQSMLNKYYYDFTTGNWVQDYGFFNSITDITAYYNKSIVPFKDKKTKKMFEKYGASLDLTASLTAKLNSINESKLQDGTLAPVGGKLVLEIPWAEIAGGVSAGYGTASGHLYVALTDDTGIVWNLPSGPTHYCLDLVGGAKVSLGWGLYTHQWPFIQYKWGSPIEVRNNLQMAAVQDLSESLELTPAGRDYLERQSGWLPALSEDISAGCGSVSTDVYGRVAAMQWLMPQEAEIKTVTDDVYNSSVADAVYGGVVVTPLKYSIFSQSAQDLISTGNGAFMVLLLDNPDRDAMNRTQVNYSIYDGFRWSVPQPIAPADSSGDFNPVVGQVASDTLSAAWINLKPGVTENTSPGELMSSTEIAVSNYDTATGQWGTVQKFVYGTNGVNLMPTIAGGNNKGLLVWVAGQQASGAVPSGEQSIVFSRYDGSAWSVPEAVYTSFSGVVSSSLAYNGDGTGIYAFCMKSKLPGLADQIYFMKYDGTSWGSPIEVKNSAEVNANPQVIYVDGRPLLVWWSDGRIVYCDDLESMTIRAAEDSGTISQDFTLDYNDSLRLVEIVGTGSSAHGRDLYTVPYDAASGLWGSAAKQVAAGALLRSPRAAFAGDNKLVAVYNKDNLVPATSDSGQVYQAVGDTDLYSVNLPVVHKLSLPADGLSVQQGNVMSGGLAIVCAQVYNTGSFTENSIEIGFYDGDPENGGKEIGLTTIPGSLAPGAGALAKIDWLVPWGHVTHQVYVVADPLHKISIVDRSSSEASLPVVQPDLALELQADQLALGNYAVIVQVTNTGGIDITGATLTLSGLNHTTDSLDVMTAEPLDLNIGESTQISFLWETTADYVYQGDALIIGEIDPPEGITFYSGDSIQDVLAIQVKPLIVTGFPPMDYVAVDSPLRVEFNDLISPGAGAPILAESSGTPVAITTDMNINVLNITPQVPLAYDTDYTLTVPANGVAGQRGDALAADFVLNFTTEGSTPAPLINNLSGVPVTGTLTIPFTDIIRQGTAFGDITLQDAEHKAVVHTSRVSDNMLKLDYSGLAYDAAYTVDIPDGALISGQGDPLVRQTLAFQTAAAFDQQPADNHRSSSSPAPVSNTTGSALVPPGVGGTVSLGDRAKVIIPAGALQGKADARVTIQAVSSPPPAPFGFIIQGQVYRFTVNSQDQYAFKKPVTLTFAFDPSQVPAGENPTVHYYDESIGQWVSLGGSVAGNLITVQVDHFTDYAVLIKAPVPQFADIAGTWAEDLIAKLAAQGVIAGYPDGTFRPNKNITRAEFAAVIVKALRLEPGDGPIFSDTRGTWTQNWVSTAAAHGIVNGYDATRFGPNDPLTREQMTAMVVRAFLATHSQLIPGEYPASEELPFPDAASISAWARDYVAGAVKDGLVNGYGDGSFRPLAYATRAEAVTVVARMVQQPQAGTTTTTAVLESAPLAMAENDYFSTRVMAEAIESMVHRASAASALGFEQYQITGTGINSQPGYLYTIAGDYARYGATGGYSGDGGSATAAGLSYPNSIAVDYNGNIYIVDTANNVIREVAASDHTQWGIEMKAGNIYTVAGSYNAGYCGDGGRAIEAELNYPAGVAVDAGGNLYIADMYNNVIRKVAASDHTQWGIEMEAGNIYTVAGKYNSLGGGYAGDGARATEAELNYPTGVAVDAEGNLYVADMGNSVIREVAGYNHSQWGIAMQDGNIYTVAGDYARYGTTGGYSGDGSLAIAAGLSYPNSVAVDIYGNLYLADSNNNVIREVAARDGIQWGQAMTAGAIYTVAGDQATGGGCGGDSGPATSAALNYPNSVAVDAFGNLYLADSNNNVIREVAAWDGTQWGQDMMAGFIYTVAGDQAIGGGYSGDEGSAIEAGLNWPAGVAVESDGDICLADTVNNVIRVSRSMDVTLAADTTGPAIGSTVNVTITIRDGQGNPVSGQRVDLTGTGSAQVTTVQGTTQENGIASFSVTDTQVETVTLTARVGNLTVGTVQVSFWRIEITQKPAVGVELTTALVPTDVTVTYRWRKAAEESGSYTDIAGATESSYTPTESDLGMYLKVVATGNGSYMGSVKSSPVGPVTESLKGIGAISGTAQVGSVLTAGEMSPADATVRYQWRKAAEESGPYADIDGATESSYTLTTTDLGRYLKVVAIGTGVYTGSVKSSPVGPVTASLTGFGAISGTAQVGSILTAGEMSPADAAVRYQWRKAAEESGPYTDISGATGNNYTLTESDLGGYLKVAAIGTGSYTGSVISGPVGPVTTSLSGMGAISGTAQVGSVLTAGEMSPADATVTYQWRKAAEESGPYTNISGAIGNSYTLTESDLGRYLKVVVTGIGVYTGSVTSGSVGPVTTSLSGIGAISGIAQVGSALTAGEVTPAGAAVTYQWRSADTESGTYMNIPGAIGSSYKPREIDLGLYLSVKATGTGVYTGSATSAPIGPVTMVLSEIGAISGTVQVGSVLTAGALVPAHAAAAYQWLGADSKTGIYTDIAGATNKSYTLTESDLGRYLKVAATGTGVYTGSATSAPIGPVTTVLSEIGAISGTAQVGSVLTSGAIIPVGATVTYQWRRADTASGTYIDISGAAGSSYTATESDLGRYLKVVATGTGIYTGSVTSAPIGPVTSALSEIGVISGKAQVGAVLTAGALTPAGATVTYQWRRADTASSTYIDISGATGSSYTLTESDLGRYLKVVATGIGAYTGSVISAATGPVKTPLMGIENISGTVQVGAALTAGEVTPAGAAVTYQWVKADDTESDFGYIAGATERSYTPKVVDKGYYLGVVATGTGSYTGSVTSSLVGPVTAPLLGMEEISGTAQVGSVLWAGELTPLGAFATYQWRRVDTASGSYTDIAGAILSRYIPMEADLGRYLKVVATGTGLYTGSVTSGVVGPVAARPLTGVTITETPYLGIPVMAVLIPERATGTYQWQAAPAADGPYSDITGATEEIYTPTAADFNQYLRVVVTGTGSFTGSVTSAAAGPVSVVTWPLLGYEPLDITMDIGCTQQITLMAGYSDMTVEDVTTKAEWSTENPEVATVNETGLVSSVNYGTTNIVATYDGKTIHIPVEVIDTVQ